MRISNKELLGMRYSTLLIFELVCESIRYDHEQYITGKEDETELNKPVHDYLISQLVKNDLRIPSNTNFWTDKMIEIYNSKLNRKQYE